MREYRIFSISSCDLPESQLQERGIKVIGTTIGTYTGPGGIGICFINKYNRMQREDMK